MKSSMRIRPNERQQVVDILRDEIHQACQRIEDRLAAGHTAPLEGGGDRLDRVRRFYEYLANKAWSTDDEEQLKHLEARSEEDICAFMREAFRLSPLNPIPGFGYLMKLMRRSEGVQAGETAGAHANPDAVSAFDRERLANLLAAELSDAAHDISARLALSGSRTSDVVRERLEDAQGRIISRFTPLV